MSLTIPQLTTLGTALGVPMPSRLRKAQRLDAIRRYRWRWKHALESNRRPLSAYILLAQFVADVHTIDPEHAIGEFACFLKIVHATSELAEHVYRHPPKFATGKVGKTHAVTLRLRLRWLRLHALNTLVRTRGERCIALLQAAIDDPFEGIARLAHTQLLAFNPGLRRRLSCPHIRFAHNNRTLAIRIWPNLAVEDSLVPLLAAAYSPNAATRLAAYDVLCGYHQSPDAMLRAVGFATWDPVYLQIVTPVFLAQTPASQLPELAKLLQVVSTRGARKARRNLAWMYHRQLQTWRAGLLWMLRGRASSAA